MQYGGLHAAGDTLYLLAAAGDMGPASQPLDFRKSTNNGAEVAVKAGCFAVVDPNVPLVAKPVHPEPHRVP